MDKKFTSFITILGILALCTVSGRAQVIKAVGKSLLSGGLKKSVTVGADISRQSSSVSAAIQKTLEAELKNTAMHPRIPSAVALDNPVLRSTFQARQTTLEPTNLFSGVVFQTQRNGKKEIYLAVAAHALDGGSQVLHKNFTVDVYVGEGKFKTVQAHIVQISAPSMLDMALGKVEQGEEDLVPLNISRKVFGTGDRAVSYGYAGKELVVVPDRQFFSKTPLCIRTTMPYPRNERTGLCGSALVDEEGNLLGIHTGSSYPNSNEEDDIGHATNAALLETLVDAFHNNGEGTFPLILGAQKILDMPVQGYISYVRLFDENGKQLWQREFEFKFGYDQVNDAIAKFSPRYIELTTRRVFWENDYLREMRSSRDKSRRTYRYDFLERKIIHESKPKQ